MNGDRLFTMNINKHGFIKAIYSVLLCICLTGCALGHGSEEDKIPENSPAAEDVQEESTGMDYDEAVEAAAEYMENMTIEEKAGQLSLRRFISFCVCFLPAIFLENNITPPIWYLLIAFFIALVHFFHS